MAKKILFPCILFLLLAAAAGPDVVLAGVDPYASPTPQPTGRITAPVISGINPDAVLSEGSLGKAHPSDSFSQVGFSLPVLMDPPPFVALEPTSSDQESRDHIHGRDYSDVNCGPTALAYALNILDPVGKTPEITTTQLGNFLSARGLMYDWGTGVEELTFAARELGYSGSYFFRDWSFEKLADVLRQAKPVVVSLGTNGLEQPGHFVTLTGISEDGDWIKYYDSARGESIMSREDFLELWQQQGSAGIIPQKNISTTVMDPMLPWMGIFSAISALALTLNQSTNLKESRVFSALKKQLANPRRKGIGAGPLPPIAPVEIQVPRYEEKTVYRGIKTVEVEVPVYVTRKVKVGIRGIKKKVPQYETQRMQVGVDTVTKQVPIYTTKKVKTGTRLVDKKIQVTRYKTVKELVWKKTTQRVPVYRYIGAKRFLVGYKNQVRWKRVSSNKQVPYKTTKTISIEVPIYKDVKVISGYKAVTEKVPRFEQKQVLIGYKTIHETIPAFEERQVQIGTKIVTREMPQYETVRVPVLDGTSPNKNPGDEETRQTSPPTGLSQEVWDSLSEVNQKKIKSDQSNNLTQYEDKWWIKALVNLKTGIVDPINRFIENPDEALKSVNLDNLPKIMSLSASSAWDINVLNRKDHY